LSYLEQKQEVLKYSQKLSRDGFFGTQTGTGGNVSLRVSGEGPIAVTPSGKNYHQIGAEEICLVDLEGKVVTGPFSPSVETGIHLAIYRHRPEVGAVIHTHQDFASVLSIINHPLPLLFDEAVHGLLHPVEIVPYAPSGSRELENHVKKRLNNEATCYLLQNHGALCLGDDLAQAFYRAELLEKCARVYYYALCTGQTITYFQD